MPDSPIVFSIPQAAVLLAVSRSTVYRLIADGTLEAVRIRSKYRVRRSAIDRFLDDIQRQRREGLVTL
ncbi:MAG: helix-turn-helix domain-containing protein [Actinomycetota bacterium]|nr:helix-turn-helix domain-containing protein [Actinomycetota bacterium]